VGRVNADDVAGLDGKVLAELRSLSEMMASIWGAMSVTGPDGRAELSRRHGRELLLSVNRYAALLRTFGIEGPFES
jgi:hypothetical protein